MIEDNKHAPRPTTTAGVLPFCRRQTGLLTAKKPQVPITKSPGKHQGYFPSHVPHPFFFNGRFKKDIDKMSLLVYNINEN